MHRFRGTSPYSSLAQSVEHLTVNQGVVGSSPTGGAKNKEVHIAQLLIRKLGSFMYDGHTNALR